MGAGFFVAQTRGETMTTVRLTPHDSADEAIQHGDAAGETAIHVLNVSGVRYATIPDSEMPNVPSSLEFAFLTFHEPSGRVITVPAD
jgi:hypothetical protein